MEEYTQPEGEVHLEPTMENRPSEQPEVQPVTKQHRRKGNGKQQEEEGTSSSQKKLSLFGRSTMLERGL